MTTPYSSSRSLPRARRRAWKEKRRSPITSRRPGPDPPGHRRRHRPQRTDHSLPGLLESARPGSARGGRGIRRAGSRAVVRPGWISMEICRACDQHRFCSPATWRGLVASSRARLLAQAPWWSRLVCRKDSSQPDGWADPVGMWPATPRHGHDGWRAAARHVGNVLYSAIAGSCTRSVAGESVGCKNVSRDLRRRLRPDANTSNARR
jgi:hypothetical protein